MRPGRYRPELSFSFRGMIVLRLNVVTFDIRPVISAGHVVTGVSSGRQLIYSPPQTTHSASMIYITHELKQLTWYSRKLFSASGNSNTWGKNFFQYVKRTEMDYSNYSAQWAELVLGLDEKSSIVVMFRAILISFIIL